MPLIGERETALDQNTNQGTYGQAGHQHTIAQSDVTIRVRLLSLSLLGHNASLDHRHPLLVFAGQYPIANENRHYDRQTNRTNYA